jgi:hypothetical protein
MSDDMESIDAEIGRLQFEAASMEHMPRTIAERFADAEAELRSAEALYQTHGLGVSAGHPGEAAHLQRQALVGLCMVVGAEKILKVERARIEAQGEGLSTPAKAERLAQLRRQIERLAAKRELAVREIEGDGFLPRPVHPELLVFPQAEVERLAR